MIYDIVVIGSGAVGSFAGYYATQEGLNVCIIDRFKPPHTQGSYHGDSRIFRIAYGEGEKYIPLLQKAYHLWEDFEHKINTELFQHCGVLNIGSKDSVFMQNILSSATKFHLNIKQLRADEITSKYGIHISSDMIGILEPHTGFIYSDLSVKSANNQAQILGAKTLWDRIISIHKKDGNFSIATSQTEIITKYILITAGSYTQEILAACKFQIPHIPLSIKRKVVNWFSTQSYKLECGFPAFILEFDNDHFYGFPDYGDGFKVGRNNTGQIITDRNQLTEFGSYREDTTEIQDYIREFFPELQTLSKGSVCSYPMSPDEDFILDFIDENVFVMGGLSHAFKFAPALGLLGIQSLCSNALDSNISRHFSLSRFKL